MNIERHLINGNGFKVPSIVITPPASKGAALIIHGYGSCKEEHLGFGWRIAELGLTTCVIDLRGHGEREDELDEKVILDVEAALEYCRQFGKVVSIGHSIGGRLSLACSADHSIGISPAIYESLCDQTQQNMKLFKNHRVRQTISSSEFFEKVSVLTPFIKKNSVIIYGSRDSQDIMTACKELGTKELCVDMIDAALHGDIFLLNETVDKITTHIKIWF